MTYTQTPQKGVTSTEVEIVVVINMYNLLLHVKCKDIWITCTSATWDKLYKSDGTRMILMD